MKIHQQAWRIAAGLEALPDDRAPREIRGAINSYNARGRGGTTARRVLRDGNWQWVSAPASRGRYLSADRNDVQYGDVWRGEIVAEFTIGTKRCVPDEWYLVVDGQKPLRYLDAARRRDGQWTLRIRNADPEDSPETIVVSDPAWR